MFVLLQNRIECVEREDNGSPATFQLTFPDDPLDWQLSVLLVEDRDPPK